MPNHFIRGTGDDPRQLGEARDLNAWAKTHSPAIALGDFNSDFDVNYTADDEAAGTTQQSQALQVNAGYLHLEGRRRWRSEDSGVR
jgi:hypothetical protein